MAFIAGWMSNAMMKPEFALTTSFSGSLDFAPGNLGEGGTEPVGFSPGDGAGKTSNGS
jgi:hypothetical protein